MIGSVQFPNDKMYEAFKYSMMIDENKKSEFITYDDNNKTVWIMWYERSSI